MDEIGGETAQSAYRMRLLRDSGRAAILDRVAHVLSEGGLDMSMAEVAEAAGVGRATLYRYFPTRQALLDSINSRALGDLSQLISAVERADLCARESLSRIARAVLAQAGIALLLMRERVVRNEGTFEESVFKPLNVMIYGAQESKEFDFDVPSRSITMLFLGLLRAGIVLVSEGSGTVEEVAANVVRLLFEGLGKQSSSANASPTQGSSRTAPNSAVELDRR